jgi:hypothetical protein
MLADFMVAEPLAVPPLLRGQEGPRLIAWGGGVRETGGLGAEARARMQILSVRGPVSASELGLGAAIPQGDPGLLLPALYTPGRDARFAGRRVCVPHFHDARTDAEIMAATGCAAVLRPGIRKGHAAVEEFLDALTSAAFVLCGSLHGAIAAAAYGTPFAFWDSGCVDLPLKWRDFADSVGIPTRFIAHVEDAVAHHRDEIAPRLVLPSLWPMLAVAPYPLRPAALLRILAHERARAGAGGDVVLDAALRAFARHDGHMGAIAAESRALVAGLVAASDRALARLANERDGAVAGRMAAEAREAALQAEAAQREAALQAEAAQREAALQAQSDAALQQARQQAAELMAQIEQIRTSTLWRLMGPLRVLGRRFPGVARLGRKTLQLGWWTVSGQLPSRLRARHVALESRAAVQSENLVAALSLLPRDPQPAAAGIHLPVPDGAPRVSVIIPSHGQVDYTLRCLASIAAAPPATPFEVLVVEDASGDPAVAQLEQVEGLRLIRWPAN